LSLGNPVRKGRDVSFIINGNTQHNQF
jgi:hypothetical protein